MFGNFVEIYSYEHDSNNKKKTNTNFMLTIASYIHIYIKGIRKSLPLESNGVFHKILLLFYFEEWKLWIWTLKTLFSDLYTIK